MPVTIDGTTGITNGGGYTGDGVSFADATPANTLVTTTGGNVGIGTSSLNDKFTVAGNLARSVARADATSSEVELEAQASDYWSGPSYTGTAIGQWGGTATGTTMGFPNASLGFLRFQNGSNGLVYTNGNAPLAFGTNSTERMRITSAGNVGIGTTNPLAKLHAESSADGEFLRLQRIGGTNTPILRVNLNEASNLATIETTGATGANLAFRAGGTDRVYISNAGNVGIGTSSPSYQLQLSLNSAAKPASNVWTVASDERVKTVTGEYTKGLDAVCSLRPVTYKYNGKAGFVADGAENISIIAQEAREAFPECIGTFSAKLNETDEEETELLNWDGHALTFALVNAIKELRAQNEDLRARLAAVEGAIA